MYVPLCNDAMYFINYDSVFHSSHNSNFIYSLIMKMMGESCLKEDTLMRVLVIGLTRELPLSPADAMDIADVLVARAANAHAEGV